MLAALLEPSCDSPLGHRQSCGAHERVFLVDSSDRSREAPVNRIFAHGDAEFHLLRALKSATREQGRLRTAPRLGGDGPGSALVVFRDEGFDVVGRYMPHLCLLIIHTDNRSAGNVSADPDCRPLPTTAPSKECRALPLESQPFRLPGVPGHWSTPCRTCGLAHTERSHDDQAPL